MNIREQIKEMSKEIQYVEKLEEILKSGTFIGSVERYGTQNNPEEFKIKGYFYPGSGVEGSNQKRMWSAVRRGLILLDQEIKKEAESIINDFVSNQQFTHGKNND